MTTQIERTVVAKFSGRCGACGTGWRPGSSIVNREFGWEHTQCPDSILQGPSSPWESTDVRMDTRAVPEAAQAEWGPLQASLADGGGLQKHQIGAIEWLRNHPRALLADGTGLGKAVTAIGHILDLRESGDVGTFLWITEANLMEQARAEFARFAPSLRVLTSADRLYSNQAVKRRRMEYLATYGEDGPDVVVVSYHKIKEAQSLWRRFGKPPLVIFDEAMAVKGGGLTAERVRELATLSPRVLAMTATPVELSPMETYWVLRSMNLPGLWHEQDFKDRFVVWSEEYQHPVTGYWVKPKPIGVREKNLPELHAYLSRYMLRRTVSDIDVPLPAWDQRRIEFVPLTAAQKRAVREVGQSGGTGHVLRQVASRSVGEESALVDKFLELLGSEFAHEPKVIAYCENLAPIKLLRERLEEVGIGYRDIQGSTTRDNRTKALEEFERDLNVRVLIGSKVLETGLNIQHCRVLVSLDCSDNPMRERQREGRIQRIGSPHATVTHVTLVPDIPQAREKLERLRQREQDAWRILEPVLTL